MDFKREKYESFEVVELVLNNDFKELVREKGGGDLHLFIEGSAGYEENIRLASSILRGMDTPGKKASRDLKDRLWLRLENSGRVKRGFTFFRYAAAIVFLLLLASGTLHLLRQPSRVARFASSTPASFKKTQLVLPNGENIALTRDNPEVKSVSNGKSVVLNDSVTIDQPQEGFVQMIVPYGKRSTVILADGTVVKLNSGSRLIYPPVFAGNTREVFLEGEAYFDVTENPEKPFLVCTDAFEVKVYGTTFNVQAYKKENLYSAVLVEGKVKLRLNSQLRAGGVMMEPMQIASLTDDHEAIEVRKVERIEPYISWIHGVLELRRENLQNLLKRVASYYNIDINIVTTGLNDGSKAAGPIRVSGKLDLKDDPERILSGIADMAEMNYKKEGDNQYILYR